MGTDQLVLTSPTPPADSMLAVIERVLISPDFDVAKLKEVLDLRRQYEADEARKAFVAAMTMFKQNPPVLKKDRTATIRSKKGESSSFSYTYAGLDSICREVIHRLSQCEISHRWTIDDSRPDFIKVSCILTHVLGHSEETSMGGPVLSSDYINALQGRAQTVSYLERYTLLAATGLAPTDSDMDANVTNGDLSERIEFLGNASDMAELEKMFRQYYQEFKGNSAAQKALISAKDRKKKELQ